MTDSAPSRAAASGTRWDPDQYTKFGDHRLRPALELLGRIPVESPRLVYDLGCGTGNVTRIIAERWPSAKIIGVDNSPQMLATASGDPSRVEWVEADLREWAPDEPPDVLYSNATLQWVEGHESLLPRLLSVLAPGGCLAVQMPLSRRAASHRTMVDVLRHERPGGGTLGSPDLIAAMARRWVLDPAEYYDLLAPGACGLDIWDTEYLQVLSGDDPVLEWVKATGLRPVLNGLAADDRERYLEEYRRRLREHYPRRADGHTLYPFRRLFIVGLR
jgi:trans-aconitate 2-methyltransferase